MNPAHKQYLWDLGFQFRANEIAIEENPHECPPDLSKGTAELLCRAKNIGYYRELLQGTGNYSLYAVMPFSEDLNSGFSVSTSTPGIDTVKRVNSKIFSTLLANEYGNSAGGEIIRSSQDLVSSGLQLLAKSPFLVKDAFGVSGKGNILVEKEQILRHLARHFQKQEQEGKETEIVIEPLLNKKTDFSCQFLVDESGTYSILSVHEMANKGFSFSGIEPAGNLLLNTLEHSGYYRTVEKLARTLFEQGYYGPVCLDSMILHSGEIIPIVEINARKSMGVISHHLNKFLNKIDCSGNIITLQLGMTSPLSFEDLLYQLDSEEILFKKNRAFGILPISANTVDINAKWARHEAQTLIKGRLYASIITGDQEQEKALNLKVKKVFDDLKIKVL